MISATCQLTDDHCQSNDFIRDIWRPRPLISAGGYTRETAIDVAEKKGDLIAFGRSFIGNVSTSHCAERIVMLTMNPCAYQPDLPVRLLKDIPLSKPDRSTYYTPGPVGYIDYPTAEEQATQEKARPAL